MQTQAKGKTHPPPPTTSHQRLQVSLMRSASGLPLVKAGAGAHKQHPVDELLLVFRICTANASREGGGGKGRDGALRNRKENKQRGRVQEHSEHVTHTATWQ